jgi:Family of unknown function (DUF6300)
VTRPPAGGRPVEIQLTDCIPCCPHCGQQGLLAASVPHGWDNPDGTSTHGTMPVVLCSACDHDDPAAGPLAVYLLVHEKITAETLRECAALIQRWTDSINIAAADEEKLEAEAAALRRGEL